MKEPFLEPILRKIRLSKVIPIISQYPGCKLLDIGCGWNALLLKNVQDYISYGVGVDFKVSDEHNFKLNNKVLIKSIMLEKVLPFDDDSFDIVTMLAVLEHLEYPIEIMKEVKRILKPTGLVLITVPSVWAQPVLEFLSWLGFVNSKEISDHKLYYNRLTLEFLAKYTGLTIKKHEYFQCYMNNFCIFAKSND